MDSRYLYADSPSDDALEIHVRAIEVSLCVRWSATGVIHPSNQLAEVIVTAEQLGRLHKQSAGVNGAIPQLALPKKCLLPIKSRLAARFAQKVGGR